MRMFGNVYNFVIIPLKSNEGYNIFFAAVSNYWTPVFSKVIVDFYSGGDLVICDYVFSSYHFNYNHLYLVYLDMCIYLQINSVRTCISIDIQGGW